MGVDRMPNDKNLLTANLEQPITLWINEKLYEKGYISAEMYTRAKLIIVKMQTSTYDNEKARQTSQ